MGKVRRRQAKEVGRRLLRLMYVMIFVLEDAWTVVVARFREDGGQGWGRGPNLITRITHRHPNSSTGQI